MNATKIERKMRIVVERRRKGGRSRIKRMTTATKRIARAIIIKNNTYKKKVSA